MLKNILKVTLFIMIVYSSANLAFCKPIKNISAETTEVEYQQLTKSNENFKAIDTNKTNRAKRQVVQPTWLTDKEVPNPFIDQRVRVTEQNLREAEAIRKSIQAAVDADTFAVDPSEPNSRVVPAKFKFPEPTSPETSPPKSQFTFFPLKFPPFPIDFSAFQRAFLSFVSPAGNVAATKDTDTSQTAEPESKPNNEFQKAWLEFVESAKKKWPSETANFPPFVSSTTNVDEIETIAASKTSKADNGQSNEFKKAWIGFMEISKQMVSSIPPAETAAENEFMADFEILWTEFEDNFMKILSIDLFE